MEERGPKLIRHIRLEEGQRHVRYKFHPKYTECPECGEAFYLSKGNNRGWKTCPVGKAEWSQTVYQKYRVFIPWLLEPVSILRGAALKKYVALFGEWSIRVGNRYFSYYLDEVLPEEVL